MRRRVSGSAAEDFAPYKLQFVDYIQHDYEVIRPVVLLAETIAERSRQTGIERTSVGDKARRFVMEGMRGLVDQRVGQAGRKGHVYPEAVAAYMLYVKQLYPPIHDREVVRILQRKFGYHTNHPTVHRFFARHALPVQLELPMPVFAAFAEAYQARWTVVRRWYAGWNKQSIAGCLQLSRAHVYTILAAFARDGFAGLEEQRPRPPQHPGNQLTLPFLKEGLDIQREYPPRAAFASMVSWRRGGRRGPRVRRPSDGRWRSIANSMGLLVRGPARRMRRRPRPPPSTSRIAHTIAIRCGSLIFGIWCASTASGSTASADWRATPGRAGPGWPRPTRTFPPCSNCSSRPAPSMGVQR